ncbi:MAG TPA: methyl-accepting chemotaxis protein [Gammaproteobacteria bacterium]|nr:methyl-accepting chemotaxis protein [Gammaproteobacteria bacterium]
MDNLRKWFTIKQLVTGGPILLLVVLSLVLGVARYYSEYEKALDSALDLAKTGAQPVLGLMKASVGGGNYANVQDEAAMDLYRANGELLFFAVRGETDANGEPYGVSYLREQDRVVRTIFPENYEKELQARITRIRGALERLPAGHRKRPRIEKMLQQKQRELEDYRQSVALQESASRQFERPSAEQITDGYYLDERNWRLHLVLPITNKGGGEIWMVMDASNIGGLKGDILMELLPINVVALLICVALAWLLARTISTPIKGMVQLIERIERNSDLTVRMDDSYGDELGQIASSLNGMLEKFQHILKEVNTSTVHVAKSAREMSVSMQEVNGRIEKQSQDTELLTTSANEMTSSFEEVTQNMTRAAEMAQHSSQQSQQGKSEVESSIRLINSLAEEVENAAEVIKKLDEDSDRIGNVLAVIKSIAEQTNLLALNAAIEAARAGEQGRGFAVVADEVRTLAQRVQESTLEIEGMIESVQVGTEQAMKTMTSGRERAEECVRQAMQAGEALELIAEAVNGINDLNSRIAVAAEQQNSVMESINANIQSIADISGCNAESLSECVSSSDVLVEQAGELHAKVTKFKVL